MNTITATLRLLKPLRGPALAGLALAGAGMALAVDIANAPLFTTSTTVVKPNVLFILDDSGSMDADYLPDDANFDVTGNDRQYGKLTSQCNGVAYDPSFKYSDSRPLDSKGLPLSAGSTSFLTSGNAKDATGNFRSLSPSGPTIIATGLFSTTVTTSGRQSSWYPEGKIVSLFSNTTTGGSRYMVGTVSSWNAGTGALVIDVQNAAQAGLQLSSAVVGDGAPATMMYYKYSGTPNTAMNYLYPDNALDTNTTFYKECASEVGSAPGVNVFTPVLVTPNSAELQNFADWYAYYRTRMDMMKANVSRAFSPLTEKYRVGFTTIHDKGVTEGDRFLNVRDFANGTSAVPGQKDLFYSKLMAINPSGSTPLRGALSKAGRYFAKKMSGQDYDPVQYSCQKNFTILSTDGYWNTDDETGYGPYALNGSSNVGQQDGDATPKPMHDGNVVTAKTTEKWNVTSTYTKTTVTPKSKTDTSAITSFTPTTGESYKTYTLGTKSVSYTNSSITLSNCSGGNAPYTCRVSVTTSVNQSLVTGNSVTISGVSPATYNGTRTITRDDQNTYYFTLSGLANKNAPTSGNRGSTLYAPDGCPAGQGLQTAQTLTRDKRNISTSTQSTITSWETTLTQTVTTVKPHTRVITVTNGVQTSDVTTNTSGSPTTSTGTTSNSASTVSTPAPVVTSGGTNYTSWVNSGAPVAAGCVANKSNDTAVVNIAVTTGVVNNAPVTTTGSTVSGTTVVGNGPVSDVAGTKTVTSSSTSTGGASNTLADVAMYYYQTDLRSAALGNCTGALDLSVCENNVKDMGKDTATWQHMTTYTLGLGNSGTFRYKSGYESGTSADFNDVLAGNKNWPVPGDDAGAVNIDDLWHAAVNGRGQFYSANNSTSLAAGLKSALTQMEAQLGSSSAAATSTLQPVTGDNGVFIAQFMSSEWTGDLRAYEMDVDSGAVQTSSVVDGEKVDHAKWSAAAKLTPASTRNIYYFRANAGTSGAGTLQPFNYATMSASEQGLFDGACNKSPVLSQCSSLSGDPLIAFNSGANMVSFLRGQVQDQYRARKQVLGDIVNSSPVYVGRPSLNYTENNYEGFKAAQASRSPTIYVGANDGMLHAFSAEKGGDGKYTANAGTERWAYIPRLVMSKLYRLADSYYESKHLYLVDATPAVGDIWDGTKWRTILVGGLNAGGSGYYALDVTDPSTPVALWEFTDATMGLSFGNPVITKRADGTWVVAFTSGYNNTGDQGHLYVVNALTGVELKRVGTGEAGGLNKLNAWIDSATENLAKRFYAGDVMGNVWRFDIDDLVEPKSGALKLAQLRDAAGNAQPITTIPQLAEVEANGGRHAVVYVGTGKYLGTTDVGSSLQQSIYAIKDVLGASGLGDVRAGGTLVKQKVDTSTSPRKVGDPDTAVNWGEKNGWYVDLASTSERINVDMELAFDTLTAAANIPGTSATDCDKSNGGSSWVYQINILTGTGKATSMGSMVAGLSSVQLAKGTGITIVTETDASSPEPLAVDPTAAATYSARRSAWRELVD